eukprot:1642357-Pyramimonas_sp.AAC.1
MNEGSAQKCNATAALEAFSRAVGRLGSQLLALWPKLDIGPNVERIPVVRQVDGTPPKPAQSWNWI